MSKFLEYSVWRRQHGPGDWSLTAHTLRARTEQEAEKKLGRMFAGCGFHSMALLALPTGQTPAPKGQQ